MHDECTGCFMSLRHPFPDGCTHECLVSQLFAQHRVKFDEWHSRGSVQCSGGVMEVTDALSDTEGERMSTFETGGEKEGGLRVVHI